MTQNSFRKHSLLLTFFILSFQSAALANLTSIAEIESKGGRVVEEPKTGKVNLISSDSPSGIQTPVSINSLVNTPTEKARNFVRSYAPLFGINNPDVNLAVKKSFLLDNQPIFKYQQYYNGVPVLAAEINTNLDQNGNLLSMSGEAASNLTLSTTPKVSAAQALAQALEVVQKEYNLSASNVNATTPQLTIYQPELLDRDGSTKLVWLIQVTPKAIAPIKQIVLVDAITPNTIVLTWNNNPHARNRRTYTANHNTILPGSLVCGEASTNANCVTPGTGDAAKAHVYAGDTYNFYRNTHGRDSINGFGMAIVSTVQYAVNYANAFWDGNQMVYGDRLAVDDVVGHELTHGVTDYTSALIYLNQSGAINESLSDVWGEFIDLTNAKGNDTAAARWKIGEDIPASIFGGPIRDMKNPPLLGHPDKRTSPFYYTGSGDNGGVHINSGINNKAAFLMTDGGNFNGKIISGIGITKVAKIYYKAQTALLTPSSNYRNLHNYLYQSCRSLIGTAAITASNCTQVRNATLAVEMNL